jgi:hypothetical protein
MVMSLFGFGMKSVWFWNEVCSCLFMGLFAWKTFFPAFDAMPVFIFFSEMSFL